jgi:hypothetical protein
MARDTSRRLEIGLAYPTAVVTARGGGANNEVTARRQKRNGMSGFTAGSHALTALSVLVSNGCQAIWVREYRIPLRFIDKAT